jgi:hypothetical protein
MAGSGGNLWQCGQAQSHREEGDKTNGWGPRISEGRERKHQGRKAQTKEENIF